MKPKNSVVQGAGLGLRMQHFESILESQPQIPWFEVLADNFLSEGGLHLEKLEDISKHYPLVFHSVALNVGSSDPLDRSYLQEYKKLIERYKPAWISDHLCWVAQQGQYFHDLLPLAYTPSNVRFVADKIKHITDTLQKPFLIENVSSYVTYEHSTLTEWDFINEVSQQAQCGILLDVNNVYVSSYNHGFAANTYLESLDKSRIKQMHLAGFQSGELLIDTHGSNVAPEVWELYKKALHLYGNVPTCIERDNDIPELAELMAEVKQIEDTMSAVAASYQAQNMNMSKTQVPSYHLQDPQEFIDIFTSKTPPATARLKIYKDNYYGALVNTLARTYKATQGVLTEDFFKALCQEYIENHGCTVRNLNDYGNNLPSFLHEHSQLQDIVFLGDLANLEWSFEQCFYASDEVLSFTDFQTTVATQQEQASFRLRTRSRLHSSEFPIHRIWDVYYNDLDERVELDEGGVKLYIHLNEHGQRTISHVEPELWPIMQGIEQGYTLEKLLNAANQDTQRLMECFGLLIQRGWLIA